jgi:hypothetical protein
MEGSLKVRQWASFDAANKQHVPPCLPNTRREFLAQIRRWANGESERWIYWLKGMAGTGKSTIALTVAREYNNKKRLGASFFFSRGPGRPCVDAEICCDNRRPACGNLARA